MGRTHSMLFMVDSIWIWMQMFTLKENRWRNECGVECDWWPCVPVSVCSDLIGCCAQGVYWTSWGGVASVVSRPSWSHWSFTIRSSSRSWPDNSRLSAAPSSWVSMSYTSMLLILFIILYVCELASFHSLLYHVERMLIYCFLNTGSVNTVTLCEMEYNI